MTGVLLDSAQLTGFMESLSHVKNEKTMLQLEQQPEFTKLVAFVNDFLDIGDLQRSRDYVNYLIDDLKILSLLELSNKTTKQDKKTRRAQFDEEVKQERAPKQKLNEQKAFEDKDSAISFGTHSADGSDEEELESQETRASFFNGKDEKSLQEFGVTASANLSKRLLRKMEFGAMMKKQVSPVSNTSL